MDLINSLPDFISISDVEVQHGPEDFVATEKVFGNLIKGAFHSSPTFQALLSKLVDECGDVESYDEWEPEDYLNFKDLVILPEGIRGLTDGFWFRGIAFSYVKETGTLHIDLGYDDGKGLNTEITDFSEEVKTDLNNLVDRLLKDAPNGLVLTLSGYTLIPEIKEAQ